MAKIMLVEDDTNLSEIYQARLTAEGYEIVSAHDGEEALALAAKEKPDLIVSDVMMPKISGFEMLDILRNTEGLKETKVIMLTALGQADDKTRAQGLGADRYLVKSQVTLEDIVKAAQELINGTETFSTVAPTTTDSASMTPAPAAPVAAPAPTPMAVTAPPTVITAPATPIAVPPVLPLPVAPSVPVPTPINSITTSVPSTPVTPPTTQTVAAPSTSMTPAPAAPVAAPAPTPMAVTAPPTVITAPSIAGTTAPQAVDPTAVADNKLVADAVEDLMKGVNGDSASALMPSNPVAPVPITTPPDPTSQPTQTPDISDADNPESADYGNLNNPTNSHKKIIKPISDNSATTKPSLESLLADEERKNPGATGPSPTANTPVVNTPVTSVPHQPGHIITPSAAEGLNGGSGIDPNSIAL